MIEPNDELMNKFAKEVLLANGIACRETPRSEEEMKNIVYVYNKKNESFTLQQKGYKLKDNEEFLSEDEFWQHCINAESSDDAESTL